VGCSLAAVAKAKPETARNLAPTGRKRLGPKAPLRKDGRPVWAAAFLAAIQACGGNVTRACEAADVSRKEAYLRREKDPDFAQEWDAAQERVTDLLEEEAVFRATDGREEVVGVSKTGVPITSVKRSDRLLEFLLKGRRRALYGDRAGVQVQFTAEQIREMSDADLDRLIAKLGG
jgi:hypothetical protein